MWNFIDEEGWFLGCLSLSIYHSKLWRHGEYFGFQKATYQCKSLFLSALV